MRIIKALKLSFAESIAENAAVPEASLGLAYAACGTEDFRSAGRVLGSALQPAAPYSIPALAFLCLPAAGILSLAEDEAQRAVELLALAFTQPQSPRGMLNRFSLDHAAAVRAKSWVYNRSL